MTTKPTPETAAETAGDEAFEELMEEVLGSDAKDGSGDNGDGD